jgi:hypothetical protein
MAKWKRPKFGISTALIAFATATFPAAFGSGFVFIAYLLSSTPDRAVDEPRSRLLEFFLE